MVRRLLVFLRQPYPTVGHSPRPQLVRALLIGLFVGLFLVLFQPFSVTQWQTAHKTLKLLGFGAVTAVVTGINFILWPYLLPATFVESRWTVGRAMFFINVNVLLIAVANYLYLHALTAEPVSLAGLGGMVVVTFLIGLFPITATVAWSTIRQLRRYQQAAAALHPPAEPGPVTPTVAPESPSLSPVITLSSENDKDRLTLPAADLLLIESSDNYCTVVYQRPDGQLARPLLRTSLTRLQGLLPNDAGLVRCHRSFLVNLAHVARITGNAQGYRLHLRGGELQVPVARQYNETLVARLKGTQ